MVQSLSSRYEHIQVTFLEVMGSRGKERRDPWLFEEAR